MFTSLARRSAGTGGLGGTLASTIRKRPASGLQRRVTFNDVAGIGEAIDELPEIIGASYGAPTAPR